jgi:S-DNA-T family DNA segregation ATPase FtsK/SpoIIIE
MSHPSTPPGGPQDSGHPAGEPDASAPVPGGPVLDAELVENDNNEATGRTPGTALERWRLVTLRPPPAAERRALVRQAARDTAVRIVLAPWRLLAAVARGGVHAVRGWRRWVRVGDYREAAEQADKLADKYWEIRELALFRWRITAGVLAGGTAGSVAVLVVDGPRYLWAFYAVIALVLAWTGRRKDGAPGRRAVLAGPRSLTWTMDPQVLVDAFRDAKLVGKDETLRLVERAHRQGKGWAITVDLPATRKAADIIKGRDALASALAVDEVQLIVERVRGRGGHAGRVAMWVADEDPYAASPIPTPLRTAERWDAWMPVPFGRDARGRPVALPLVWTSLLVGSIPRQGKTFAARLPAAGLILDPYTRLCVFDGKGGKDWKAAETVAYRFVCGDDPAHVEAVRDGLVELVAETQARFARMGELPDEVCPESKITPQISRNPALNMPITAVIIDEVQVFLEDPTRQDVGARKTTIGAYIADLLTYLAKKGPAAGIIVILATQRPDSTTMPPRLRAVLGSRFALRVMDWRDSNIILGEQMNTRGYDSSKLLPSHKGVGILRPDGEAEAGAEVLAMTVRSHYMPNPEWRAICERGRALREAADTLAGHAASESAQPIDAAAAIKALGSRFTADGPDDDGTRDDGPPPPEPLASVVGYLGDDLTRRTFVPTAELLTALGAEATAFGRGMGALGCNPRPSRITDPDGIVRQVRGYLTADLRAAVDRHRDGP